MTKDHIQSENESQETTQRRHQIKASITQRLRTNLGRSFGTTTVIQLVWLNRFTGFQLSHLQQKLCSQKDTHLKLSKWSAL